jgi:hypothetical protein
VIGWIIGFFDLIAVLWSVAVFAQLTEQSGKDQTLWGGLSRDDVVVYVVCMAALLIFNGVVVAVKQAPDYRLETQSQSTTKQAIRTRKTSLVAWMGGGQKIVLAIGVVAAIIVLLAPPTYRGRSGSEIPDRSGQFAYFLAVGIGTAFMIVIQGNALKDEAI